MMQALGRRYAHYFNRTYQRTGTLWEGRYKSSLIDSEQYLLTCMRYIEMNPVRARMVKHPGDYIWSSYPANAQFAEDGLVRHHPIYYLLVLCTEERQAAYRELFREHINKNTEHEIRAALNQELVSGRSYFKDKSKVMTNRQTTTGKPCVEEEGACYYVFSILEQLFLI